MAVIKCKMCGGAVDFTLGEAVSGLFTGKHRREIENRLAEIRRELE